MGKKHFCFFQTAETGKRTPNSSVKGSGANHYHRAPAQAGGEGATKFVAPFLTYPYKMFIHMTPQTSQFFFVIQTTNFNGVESLFLLSPQRMITTRVI